jgi:hypothetical protein
MRTAQIVRGSSSQGRIAEVRIETYAAGTRVQKIVETDNDADGTVDSSTTTTYLNDSSNFTVSSN